MQSDTEPTVPQKAAARGDRIEVIKVLTLMIVSFVVGFALVILFLRPDSGGGSSPRPEQPSAPAQPVAPVAKAPEEPRYTPPEPVQAAEPLRPPDVPAAAAGEANPEAEAPPEVPPGRTPPGVAVSGAPLYLKCWDKNGQEHPGESCGRLSVFEKRFDSRLYVVNSCKAKLAGESAEGKLSLGVEIDFEKLSVTFWNGSGSTLQEGAKIAGCLRSALAGLPIGGIEAENVRYRMFFTVLFGKAAQREQQKAEAPAADPGMLKKGKMLEVVKDRVRVRSTPGEGEVIGRISSGNQVRLIEAKGGWCLVVTPNNNQGWMTCDALGR